MDKLSRMPNPSRVDLENSARDFFHELKEENDLPRKFHPDTRDNEISLNVELSRARIRELDEQLKANEFEGYVEGMAARLVAAIGGELSELEPRERLIAMQLAARSDRERQEHFVHLLTSPAQQYAVRDQLFAPLPIGNFASPADTLATSDAPTLGEASVKYLGWKVAQKVGVSQRTELKRVLDWLQERVGSNRQIDFISKAELRAFRDDLGRVDVRLRGRKLSFDDRLTNKDEYQIKSVTALRYWNSVQGFFAWATAEEHIKTDPAESLKLAVKKDQERRSPEAFDPDELKQLFQSPLYSGYRSADRPALPGNCHIRDGRWWCGILFMFTGMRAAEVSQLLPSDFVFDHEFPHVRVQRGDSDGNQVKTVKNKSSLRDVPLAPELLELGFRQFVERRAKSKPKARIFREFRLGTDRMSDGVTKFWGSYLKRVGLWKAGRSTHVWRHTLVARLRHNGVSEEDIQAVIGHSRGTVTAGYGGVYPLSRTSATIGKLDFGFDVVAALGGAYDHKIHA